MQAWRHLHAARQQRQAATLAARRRVDMGALRRCLHAWRGQCGRHEGRQVALQRAQLLLRRGQLARCWREWRRLCALRWWKVQLEARDGQIQRLGQALRHLESRPVRYLARYRQRAQLTAWRQQAAYQRAKRAMGEAAAQHARRTTLAAALGGWMAVAGDAAAQRRVLGRVQRRLARLRAGHALAAWQAAAAAEAAWRQQAAAAKQLRRRHLLQRVLWRWRSAAWLRHTARHAAQRRQQAVAAAVLRAWRQQAALVAAREALLSELEQARAARLAARSFGGWLAHVEGRQARRRDQELARWVGWGGGPTSRTDLLGTMRDGAVPLQVDRPLTPPLPPPSAFLPACHPCSLADRAERLQGEAAQLAADNERLCRVVDSGDWGRARVQELVQVGGAKEGVGGSGAHHMVGLGAGAGADYHKPGLTNISAFGAATAAPQAGRVLQEERDALARLVASCGAGSSTGGALQDATNSPGPGSGTAAAAAAAAAACSLDGRLQHYRVTPAGIQPEAGTGPGASIGAAWPQAASPPAGVGARPTSPGASAAARNRLLVRQGSSFNALVRALKQDLVGTGALARAGPATALEIDKARFCLFVFSSAGAALLCQAGTACVHAGAAAAGTSRAITPCCLRRPPTHPPCAAVSEPADGGGRRWHESAGGGQPRPLGGGFRLHLPPIA